MLKYSVNGRCHLSRSTKYLAVSPFTIFISFEGQYIGHGHTSNLATEVIFIIFRQLREILEIGRFLRD